MFKYSVKNPASEAQICIIWLHGLGASAADMASLSTAFSFNELPVCHVFVDAPIRPVTLNRGFMMQAWYDITGLKLTDREDKPGIEESAKRLQEIIAVQLNNGFNSNQIILAGFSQGGAMALYTALNYERPLAGVISLSAYLPLANECQILLARHTPIFIARGMHDTVVLPEWTKKAEDWLTMQGFTNISSHQYPMEHTICLEEVRDIAEWLISKTGVKQHDHR